MARETALIADPSPLFREGLRRLLQQGRFVIAAEGRNVAEAIEASAESELLSLVVCTLDDETGRKSIASLNELKRQFDSVKIIVIADLALAPTLWYPAIEVSDAILARDVSSKVLQRSIDLVMLGQRFLPAPLLDLLLNQRDNLPRTNQQNQISRPQDPVADIENVELGGVQRPQATTPAIQQPSSPLSLSDRESQIVKCLVRGDPNKVIARELCIAEATVKVHVKGLLRKLRAANRTQVAVWALNNGMEVSAAE